MKMTHEQFNKKLSWFGIIVFLILAIQTEFFTHATFTSGQLLIFIMGYSFLFYNAVSPLREKA